MRRSAIAGMAGIVSLIMAGALHAGMLDGSTVSWDVSSTYYSDEAFPLPPVNVTVHKTGTGTGLGTWGDEAKPGGYSYGKASATVNGSSAVLGVESCGWHNSLSYGWGSTTLSYVLQVTKPTAYTYALQYGGTNIEYTSQKVLNQRLDFSNPFHGNPWVGSGVLMPGPYYTQLGASGAQQTYDGMNAQGFTLTLNFLPEPMTLGLFVLGALPMVRSKRRRS